MHCSSAGHSVQAHYWPILMGADRRVFPWGVHRYRGDNVERDVYGGVWMTHPVIARVSLRPELISPNEQKSVRRGKEPLASRTLLGMTS